MCVCVSWQWAEIKIGEKGFKVGVWGFPAEMALVCRNTHTHTLSLSLSHSFSFYFHTYSFSLSHTHTPTLHLATHALTSGSYKYIDTEIYLDSLVCSKAHTHTHTRSRMHAHTHTHTHARTHTLTHTHSHTLTHQADLGKKGICI